MRRRGLSRFERRWAVEVYDAIVPGGIHPEIPEGAGTLGAGQTLDEIYGASSFLGAVGFRGGLWLLWLLPPFVLGKLSTLGGLSADEREAYVQRLYRHRFYVIRQLTFLMKLVAATGYFRHPRVRAAFRVYEREAADLPVPRLGARGTEPERKEPA